MSNALTKGRVIAIFAIAALLVVGAVAMVQNAGAVAPSDYGLKEGDTVSAAGSSDPDVYIVNDWGYKRLFLNPAIFGFYAHLGGFANVKTVSPATRDAFGTSGLFRNCETNDQKVYGVQTTGEDTGVLHWVNTSGAQAVADDANFFKKVFCINSNEFNWYAKGTEYTSVNQVPVYSRDTNVVTTTGNLSASLTSDNPVSGTIIASQSLATLLKVRFTNSGSTAVNATKVVFQRIGISGDTTLDGVYLFSGSKRLTDSGSVSSGKVTFTDGNGVFTVPANGSVDITVRADILSGSDGQTVGASLVSINDSAMSLSGSIMNIAAAPSDLEDVHVGTVTPYSDGTSSIDAQADFTVWQSTFTVSNKDVYLRSLALREIGSVLYSDINNFRLYADGTLIATTSNIDSNGYVTLTPATPTKLLTGGRVLKVIADIVGGTYRDFSFSLRGAYDVDVYGSNYGVNVKATVPTSVGTYPLTTDLVSVNAGSITVAKATDYTTTNLVNAANDQLLGKFTLTAYGEPVKIEKLYVEASVSSLESAVIGGLRNGRVVINGAQYGSTTTLANAATTSFTVNFTVTPGSVAIVEVRGDVYDSDSSNGVNANDIIKVKLSGSAANNNGQGTKSLQITDVPGADVAGNSMTVKAGSMSLAKYTPYVNQTVIVPKSPVMLGKYVLTGNATEDINVNTFDVGFWEGDLFTQSQVTNVYLKYGSSTSVVKATVADASSSSYSVNFTLAKNQNMEIEVWGNVASFTVANSNDTMQTILKVSGTTASSATATDTGAIAGQVLTAGTGSFSVTAQTVPVAQIVDDGAGTIDVAGFKFSTANESYTLTEVGLTVSAAKDAAVIQNVILKSGGTTIGTLPMSGTGVTFTGISIPLALNGDTTLTAAVQLGQVGAGNASSAADVKLTLDNYKYINSSGTETPITSGAEAGKDIYVHKSYPTITKETLGTKLLNGSNTFAKFTVSANGGDIGWDTVKFNLAKTASVSISSASLKLYDSNNNLISGTWTIGNTGGTGGIGYKGTTGSISFTPDAEELISGSKTYLVKSSIVMDAPVTYSGDPYAGYYVNLSIDQAASYLAPTIAASVKSDASYAATFVWSDRSEISHNTTTDDWMNDYLVKNLPTESWSLTY